MTMVPHAGIHGSTRVLDVVLTELARRGIRAIFDLGSSRYGLLRPPGKAPRNGSPRTPHRLR